MLDGTSMESGWPPLIALLPGYVTGKGYVTGVGSWAGGTGRGDDGLLGCGRRARQERARDGQWVRRESARAGLGHPSRVHLGAPAG